MITATRPINPLNIAQSRLLLLPLPVQDSIFRIVLAGGVKDRSRKETILPLHQVNRMRKGESILDSLLICRQLYFVVIYILYSQGNFNVWYASDLAALLDNIGPMNTQRLRYISLHAGVSSETQSGDECVKEWVAQINRLPVELRGLGLYFEEPESCGFRTEEETHPLVRAAVQRFRHLEQLRLAEDGEFLVPWDLLVAPNVFSGSKASNQGRECLSPTFPRLRTVYRRASD